MRRCLLALVLLAAPPALAQQDERLPDLTPREFTIVGDLQISLPDLERQPLRGFAPPPRTYVVPADRQPFVAPYAQRVDDLPEMPLSPPAAPSIVRAVPRLGQIDLAAGTHLGRRGRLTLSGGGIGVDVNYDGFSDFAPFEDRADLTTNADNLTGRISFSAGDVLRFGVAVDGAYHQYGLLGAYPTTLFADLISYPERRRLHTVGAEGSLEGAFPAFPFLVATRYESNSLRDLPERSRRESDVDPIGLDEERLVVATSFSPGPLEVDGALGLSGLGGEGLGASLAHLDAGGTFGLPIGAGRLAVGARVFGFDASEANGGVSMIRVGPVAEFDLPLAGGVRAFARTRAGATARSVGDLFGENPYAEPAPVLAPDLHLVDAEGGFEVQRTGLRLTLFGGARLSSHLLYFERMGEPSSVFTPPARLYAAHYDEAALLRGGTNVTVYGPGNISASAGVEVRASRLTAQDRAIPFVAPLAGRLSLAVPFDNTRGLLQASLYAESARPTGIADERAPSWADVTVEGHYRFAGRFGLLVRADHLGVRAERWPGFPNPPTVITAGLRAGW
jgi:hypothetical protein